MPFLRMSECVLAKVVVRNIGWVQIPSRPPHLTTQAKAWLEKIREKKTYNIQIWENEKLEKLLLKYPSIIEKYFPNPEVEIDFKPYLISIINENKEILEGYISLNISYQTFSGEEKVSKIDQLVENYHKIILIGEPGSGKTGL